MKTKVIFRKWNDTGDVVAMFPEVPSDTRGDLCMIYQHIGQHGAAYPHVLVEGTTPATKEEAADLKRELEGIGYVLTVRKRSTSLMQRKRQKVARAQGPQEVY